jgi:hypothetical protein
VQPLGQPREPDVVVPLIMIMQPFVPFSVYPPLIMDNTFCCMLVLFLLLIYLMVVTPLYLGLRPVLYWNSICYLLAPPGMVEDTLLKMLVALLYVFMDQMMQNYQIMSWNVRGLNRLAR